MLLLLLLLHLLVAVSRRREGTFFVLQSLSLSLSRLQILALNGVHVYPDPAIRQYAQVLGA